MGLLWSALRAPNCRMTLHVVALSRDPCESALDAEKSTRAEGQRRSAAELARACALSINFLAKTRENARQTITHSPTLILYHSRLVSKYTASYSPFSPSRTLHTGRLGLFRPTCRWSTSPTSAHIFKMPLLPGLA